MTREEAIEFLGHQQKVFGEGCLMHGTLTMAKDIIEKIEKCDETSATRCFTCINEIKERYK